VSLRGYLGYRLDLAGFASRVRAENAGKGIATPRREMRAFMAKIRGMDKEPDQVESAEGPSGRWQELWHDRMGFAANQHPGATGGSVPHLDMEAEGLPGPDVPFTREQHQALANEPEAE
jgi:hypothetical protein